MEDSVRAMFLNVFLVSDSAALVRIVSYNILAQSYVKSVSFPHSPSPCLR